jgi:hypothetical protein
MKILRGLYKNMNFLHIYTNSFASGRSGIYEIIYLA